MEGAFQPELHRVPSFVLTQAVFEVISLASLAQSTPIRLRFRPIEQWLASRMTSPLRYYGIGGKTLSGVV